MKIPLVVRTITTAVIFTVCSISAMINQVAFDPVWGFSVRQGKRPTMEDTHVALNPFGGHRNWSFFAIYDGHGGREAAVLAAPFLQNSFATELAKNPNAPIAQLLTNAFLATEQDIKQRNIKSGTTAAVAFAMDNQLYVAWVGDSRALLIRGPREVFATQDHKPDTPGEKARIEKVGGKIEKFGPVWRVPGGLAIARSLGDFDVKNLKPQGVVIPNPQVQRVEIKDGDFLVIACDGLWDEFNNDQVVKMVNDLAKKDIATLRNAYRQPNPPHEIAEEGGDEQMRLISRALRDEAFKKGSSDNISVMVIQYRAPKAAGASPVRVENRPAVVTHKENVMSSLETLKNSLVNPQEKQIIGGLIALLQKGYTKATLTIVNEQLEPMKTSKIVYFDQPATAKGVIETLQKTIAKDLALPQMP